MTDKIIRLSIRDRHLMYAGAVAMAGPKETRIALCGVHIAPSFNNNNGVFIVATDGKLLSIGYDPEATTENLPGVGITLAVPKNAISPLKARTDKPVLWQSDTRLLSTDGKHFECPEIEQTYPAWDRLISSSVAADAKAEGPTYSAHTMRKLALIAEALTPAQWDSPSPIQIDAGEGMEPRWVSVGYENWRGVIMPLKSMLPSLRSRPSWLS